MSRDTNYETSNYPPSNDSTSSGGYGSSKNVYADSTQRGRTDDSSAGLTGRSTTGVFVGDGTQDAMQGKDAESRREYAREAERDFGVESNQGLNPYGKNPDSKQEASEMLASGYSDARGRDYETGVSMEDA
ncbi:hypothetical protein PHLGIDRAFT_33597 [Phlebiopsis gigantea 11061_1 CR5-6]|uniref:Uncharacterized protein n=1 Tax=Phlebiopsis gigantea (strain 11061_1 CR5-6) TaxID=745531 RepID=A0A0C3SCM4_PHLG1|nr:hypothetical protein PHLGIDRAFT_33597 [Phlebiopsis gigantea 11061_1 CR5-6]